MRRTILLRGTCALAALAAALILAGGLLQGQTPSATQTPAAKAPASSPKPRSTHIRKRRSVAHPAIAPPVAPVTPEPVKPVEPPKPDWPANAKPAEASVVWDSHGLHITAANSSLEQILKDIAASTGAKIEGLGADQRVFGDYGPGQVRDVLTQLLQGSGYNIMMIGDQGQGAPRQVLLSARQAGPAQPSARTATPAASNIEEDEPEEPAVNVEPVQGRPGFPPGVPPRSPQQIMQEMQQRQQQLNPQGQPQPGQPQPNNPQN